MDISDSINLVFRTTVGTLFERGSGCIDYRTYYVNYLKKGTEVKGEGVGLMSVVLGNLPSNGRWSVGMTLHPFLLISLYFGLVVLRKSR